MSWTLPIIDRIDHGAELCSLYFDDPGLGEPGQFFMLWLPDVGERPISISGRQRGRIEFSVKSLGPFSRALASSEPGQRVGLRGPYGRGYGLVDHGLLVGGGCGIAPLRFLAQRLREEGRPHLELMAARSAGDLLFAQEARARGAVLVTEDGSLGERGLVTEHLANIVQGRRVTRIYTSGPEAMLVAVIAIARKRGLPFEVSLERYMKCALGLCGQCCLDPGGLRVCVEGPVFDQEQLDQIDELGQPHRDASGRRRGAHIACEIPPQ